MLHTVYITHRITSKKTYNEIYEGINKLLEAYNHRLQVRKDKNQNTYYQNTYYQNTYYQSKALNDLGFNKIILRKYRVKNYEKSLYMQLEMILNPIKLISNNHIKITKLEDIKEISEIFNNIIKAVHKSIPVFEEWTLNRIDYCRDISTRYADAYIELFQKGDRPSIYFKELYDEKSHRRRQREGSFYMHSKSVGINFYAKEVERESKGKLEEAEQAKNILRLEVQLNKSKTDYMRYKYDFKIKHLKYFLDEELSEELISYYYIKSIGKEPFYTLEEAVKKIKKSTNIKENMKGNLIDTLTIINQCRSVRAAKDKQEKYKDNTFKEHIKRLRKLNINPITIPQKWRITKLDNPINLNT